MTSPVSEAVCATVNKTGGFLYRPWYDALALPFTARLLFPLSRAWAAASAIPADHANPIARHLKSFPGRNRTFLDKPIRATVKAAAAHRVSTEMWETAAFNDGTGSRRAPRETQEYYQALRKATTAWMACRWKFLPAQLIRGFPAVHAAVEAPDIALDAQAEFLSRLSPPHRVKAVVSGWHDVPGLCRRRWLRAPSPTPFNPSDMLWAQHLVPVDGEIKGTIVLAHGIAMEEEFWLGISATTARLLREGFALILPEGPGHQRRMLPGWYGGENAMVAGPLSFTHYLNAHARELASLVAWARAEGEAQGPVLLSGISLGALTVQTLLSKGADWGEAAMVPDGALLITACDDFASILEKGRLATDTGLSDSVRAAGWDSDHIDAAALILNPADHPALPGEKIGIVLGTHDVVLPIKTGHALAARWRIPEENIFLRRQGHFSASLGLAQAPEPFLRMMSAIS